MTRNQRLARTISVLAIFVVAIASAKLIPHRGASTPIVEAQIHLETTTTIDNLSWLASTTTQSPVPSTTAAQGRWNPPNVVAQRAPAANSQGHSKIQGPSRTASTASTTATVKATTTTQKPTTTATTALQSQWRLIAEDQFTGPLSANWGLYEGPGNAGVGLRDPKTISVANGLLTISGTKANMTSGGMAWMADQTFGKWEVRARTDAGIGFGPCILLWPKNNADWPQAGEVDLMEQTGDRKSTSFTVHYDPANKQVQYSHDIDGTQWHTYGVEWTKDLLTYTYDGQPLYSVTRAEVVPDGPMHLAIQLDVFDGGSPWTPAADATTPDTVNMQVDWVRIYQLVG